MKTWKVVFHVPTSEQAIEINAESAREAAKKARSLAEREARDGKSLRWVASVDALEVHGWCESCDTPFFDGDKEITIYDGEGDYTKLCRACAC